MIVSVKFAEQCRPELDAWQAAVEAREPNGRMIAAVAIAMLLHDLKRYEGYIPGADFIEGSQPPTAWWNFHESTAVKYRIKDSSLFGFRRRRRITITKVGPPPRGLR